MSTFFIRLYRKTNCKKKYCACFSRGNYCDGCECKNCENCPSAHPPYATIPKNDENSENFIYTSYNNYSDNKINVWVSYIYNLYHHDQIVLPIIK